MEITTNSSICYDLLAIQLGDGVLDLSWAVDTDTLKEILEENGIKKILNFQDNVDFLIQIDNVNTFDSINLKTYNFSSIEKIYRGNIVFSAIIPFNKNKFEETNYYFRVRLIDQETSFSIYKEENVEQTSETISFVDDFSETKPFTIAKNYTKDLVESMYKMVADFNAYNKEAKSANMYYIFQALAVSLNEEFEFIQDTHNQTVINKSLPDFLVTTFGVLFKFSNAYGITMEEYRRIMKKLIIAYQHGGVWNYIKEVLKYLIGYTPELVDMKNFYPWILRKNTITDPKNFSERNYYNPQTNYYLYKLNYFNQDANNPAVYYPTLETNRNLIMMLDNYQKLFTFIVKTENFYNRDIDTNKIKEILNLLKSAYTKYSLNITEQEEVSGFNYYIYINDQEEILLANDEQYIRY